jgi:hypothetical protein
MKEHVSRLEFRAKLTRDRSIPVPRELAARLRPGQSLLVSVDPRGQRAAGGIYSDEEIDRIARLQAEPPGAVRKCLDSQGSLAGSANFLRRFPVVRRGRAG